MLIVLSDLHLTDESTANNVRPEAFTLLGDEILSSARSHEAKDLHVVLLGDIYDLVRTDYWWANSIPDGDRPWGGVLDPLTGMNAKPGIEAQFKAILANILAQPTARALADTLGSLRKHYDLQVTYVIGNHDRVLHNYASLQEMISAALGSVTFQSEARLPEYAMLARHGHEWDENCHAWRYVNEVLGKQTRGFRRLPTPFEARAYQTMAVGEVVTAELMSGFISRVQQNLPPAPDRDDFLRRLKDVNNLRPQTDVFAWLDWFGRAAVDARKPVLHSALKESLTAFLDTRFAQSWDELVTDILIRGDLTDRLTLVRNVVLGDSFEEFRQRMQAGTAVARLTSLLPGRSAQDDDQSRGAQQERDWAKPSPDVQFVVYGHTHVARHEAFSSTPDDSVRMYINVGTYLPYIERTRDGHGFTSASQITLAFFYHQAEDTANREGNGPTVEFWTGFRRKRYLPRKIAGTQVAGSVKRRAAVRRRPGK